ncbi:restriction endonuclease [Promicromonospora soli]
MEPRLAYRTAAEQIDGSLTFNTDDYIVEAKWLSGSVDRAAADAFAAKVRRKGKNALGLFVAVNGFSSVALDTYREGTPFLTMDGADIFLVLDGRIRLDDLLRAKRRHANETGSCSLPAAQLLGSTS